MLFDRRAPMRTRLWYGTGILALGAALVAALDVWRGGFGYDFAAYVLAARRLTEGLPLYPTEVVPGPFGRFFYPPLIAAALIPATAAPKVAAGIWMVVILAIAIVVGWTLVRQHDRADRPWVAAAYVLFPPLLWDLGLGNVTLVAAALAMLAWHVRAHRLVSGALLAASIALKPLAVATTLVWLLTGRARTVAWSAVAGLAVVVLTWPWLGDSWIAYARVVGAIASSGPGTVSNIVPSALGGAAGRMLLPLLALCASVAAALAARSGRVPEGHAFRLALAVGPLVATTLQYPYLLFALPLLLHPGRDVPAWGGRPMRVGRVAAWMLMLAQFVREPERPFTLPLLGLLALVLLGLVPLIATLRSRTALSEVFPRVRPSPAAHI